VSRYIGAVSDHAQKFAVQFPDEMGTHRLPGWLQSFAWVMHSLRGEPVTWMDALALVQQFRARVSADVLREAVELSRRFAELPLDRAAVDEEVLRTLIGHRLVRQNAWGQWRFCEGVAEALGSLAALPGLSEGGVRPTRTVLAVARPLRIKPEISSRVKPRESRRASVRPSAELASRLSARRRLIFGATRAHGESCGIAVRNVGGAHGRSCLRFRRSVRVA
jgi:hypothetical protein